MEATTSRLNTLIETLIREGLIKDKQDLAEQIGVKMSTLQNIIYGINPLSGKFVKILSLKYPFLNMDWLENGNGDIYSYLPTEKYDIEKVNSIIDTLRVKIKEIDDELIKMKIHININKV